MRSIFNRFVAAAVFVLMVLGLFDVFAQELNIDPTVVAPEEFMTVFENDRVRVVRVIVVDGTRPARHSHPDRVVIFVSPCTWLETADDGSIEEEPYPAGAVSWQEAITHESYPNQVKETCELLEVELK